MDVSPRVGLCVRRPRARLSAARRPADQSRPPPARAAKQSAPTVPITVISTPAAATAATPGCRGSPLPPPRRRWGQPEADRASRPRSTRPSVMLRSVRTARMMGELELVEPGITEEAGSRWRRSTDGCVARCGRRPARPDEHEHWPRGYVPFASQCVASVLGWHVGVPPPSGQNRDRRGQLADHHTPPRHADAHSRRRMPAPDPSLQLGSRTGWCPTGRERPRGAVRRDDDARE